MAAMMQHKVLKLVAGIHWTHSCGIPSKESLLACAGSGNVDCGVCGKLTSWPEHCQSGGIFPVQGHRSLLHIRFGQLGK